LTTNTEISIPIYGMSCQKCVAKVTAALQAVSGVSAVAVSLEEQQGWVQVADGGPGRQELLDVVTAAGFQVAAPVVPDQADPAEGPAAGDPVQPAETVTSNFVLQGMTCANCAQTRARTRTGAKCRSDR
jgi:Cu+-exporting ATPase